MVHVDVDCKYISSFYTRILKCKIIYSIRRYTSNVIYPAIPPEYNMILDFTETWDMRQWSDNRDGQDKIFQLRKQAGKCVVPRNGEKLDSWWFTDHGNRWWCHLFLCSPQKETRPETQWLISHPPGTIVCRRFRVLFPSFLHSHICMPRARVRVPLC